MREGITCAQIQSDVRSHGNFDALYRIEQQQFQFFVEYVKCTCVFKMAVGKESIRAYVRNDLAEWIPVRAQPVVSIAM